MEEIGEATCSQAIAEKPSPAEEEELPVVLTMNKYNDYDVKYFICQLPENPSECHRFTVTSRYKLTDGSVEFMCVCTRCRYLSRSYADKVTYRVRVSDNHGFVIYSPKENHFHKCSPEDYKYFIKQCPEVSEEIKKEFIDVKDPSSGFATGGDEVPVILSLHRYNNQYQFFVCQLPRRPKKCYKFTVTSRNMLPDGTVQFTSVCTRCRGIKGHTTIAKYLIKVTDNQALFISSPEQNHQKRCTPDDFHSVIKLHPKVTDEVKNKIINGESITTHIAPQGYPFEVGYNGNTAQESEANSESPSLLELAATIEELPIEVWVNNRRTAFFVCKLPSQDSQEPQKCVKFKVMSSEKLPDGSMEFSLSCPCRYQPANSFIWKSDGVTVSRPLDNHLPSCRPVFYDDVVRHEVKEEVKQKILRGESIDMYLLPFGSPYVDDGRNSEEPHVSMSSYLLASHPKVAELPVIMVANRKQPENLYFICRLPSDPQKCMYFYVADREKLPDGTMEFSVECTKCHSKYRRPLEIPMRKSNGLTLSHPLDNHLSKCDTWKYDRLLVRNPAVFDEVKRKILAGESIKTHLPPLGMPFPIIKKINKRSIDVDRIMSLLREKRKKEKPTTSKVRTVPQSSALIALLNKKRENPVERERSSRKRTADWTIHHEQCSPSMINYLQQIVNNIEPILPASQRGMDVSSQMSVANSTPPDSWTEHPIQHHSNEKSAISLLPQPSVPIDSLVVKRELAETVEPSPSIVSSPIPTDLPVSNPVSVRKIQLAVPKKFEKKFDANIFTEDEVDISVNGKVLTVLFERKSSIGPSRSSHSLAYEHDLPDYVIVDSLSTSFENGQLIVTANTTST